MVFEVRQRQLQRQLRRPVMGWWFRKTKTFGGLRLSVGRRGVGTSIGWGPLRFSRGADGRYRRTIRIAPGVWRTDNIQEDK